MIEELNNADKKFDMEFQKLLVNTKVYMGLFLQGGKKSMLPIQKSE